MPIGFLQFFLYVIIYFFTRFFHCKKDCPPEGSLFEAWADSAQVTLRDGHPIGICSFRRADLLTRRSK